MNNDARARERADMLARTGDLWEELRGARVFFTGGTGFVGTWMMEAFIAANEAYGLGASAVLLTRDPARVRVRTPHIAAHPSISYIAGDATSFPLPNGEFAFVVHAATEKPFPPESARPLGVVEPDLVATRRVLDFARTHGTRRLLFTSSGAVYGMQPSDMAHVPETYMGAPDTSEARAAYGESKRLSEFACINYARTAPFDAVVARLFAFVGPYLPLDEGFAVGNFIADVLAGRAIAIGGDGTPHRSYLYAADLAVWCWTLLVRGTPGRAYNVGSPHGVTIHELAKTVARTIGRDTEVTLAMQPMPTAASSRYVPNVDRARTELGLDAWVPLDEGIRRTYEANRA